MSADGSPDQASTGSEHAGMQSELLTARQRNYTNSHNNQANLR